MIEINNFPGYWIAESGIIVSLKGLSPRVLRHTIGGRGKLYVGEMATIKAI